MSTTAEPTGQGTPDRLGALRQWLGKGLAIAAGAALLAMMLFTALDVLLRTFGKPLAGSFEVIGWLSAAAMALALGYAQVHKSHVAMTLLSDRLEGRKAVLADMLNNLVALGLFGFATYYLFRYGSTLQSTGSLSETLKVVVFPWVYVVATGFAGLAVVLIIDVVRGAGLLLRPAARRG